MLFNFVVLFVIGGIFCLVLVYYGYFGLVVLFILIFYGFVVINVEKYIFLDVKYLGFCELILGCIFFFYIGYGLIFWIIGFGILYILYGLIMFKKYK